MLKFRRMKKREAIDLFGGLAKDLAAAVGITQSAVSQWPEDLPQETADRVRGAAIRLNKWPRPTQPQNETKVAA